MKKDKKSILLIILVLLLIIVDQGLKAYSCINSNNMISKVNMGQSNIITTIITNIIVLGIIIRFFVNQKDRIDTNLVIVIAFLLAGGVSNLIDKVFRGNIVNYIKLYNLPETNLAFVFIIIGWIGLAAIFAWNTYKEFKEKQNKQDVN